MSFFVFKTKKIATNYFLLFQKLWTFSPIWCIIVEKFGILECFGLRILVFSDTHGMIENCNRTVRKLVGVDMIIHAGDASADAVDMQREFSKIPVKYVRGNSEISQAPPDLFFECDGVKIFLTHGQHYYVKSEASYHTLITHARELGADIVVFGHTHIPICDNLGDITVLNPGSARFGGTYGVIEIENGKAKCCVLDI